MRAIQKGTFMTTSRNSVRSIIERCSQPAPESVCLQILSDLRPVFLGNAARHDSIKSRLILFESDMGTHAKDMQYQMHEMPHGNLRSTSSVSIAQTYRTPLTIPELTPKALENAKSQAQKEIKQPSNNQSVYEPDISAYLEFQTVGAGWDSKDLFFHASFDAAFALVGLCSQKTANLRHPPLLPAEFFRLGKIFADDTGLPSGLDNRWLLFLHLLGWQQFHQTPIRARRFITIGNSTLYFGNIEQLQDQFFSEWMKAQLGKDFDTTTLHFFGSDLYHDLNLASVHAIDLILTGILNEPSVDSHALGLELDLVKPGQADAHKYHDVAFRILSYLFSPSLQDGAKEVQTDEGRERVDIVYANRAEDGYFYELRMQHALKCPFVFFECKNYSGDVANPEFSQLHSRLSESRGKVGFLVCRKITNQDKVLERCKDSFTNHGTHILVLDDDDLKALLSKKANNDVAGMWGILRTRFRRILLNQ